MTKTPGRTLSVARKAVEDEEKVKPVAKTPGRKPSLVESAFGAQDFRKAQIDRTSSGKRQTSAEDV